MPGINNMFVLLLVPMLCSFGTCQTYDRLFKNLERRRASNTIPLADNRASLNVTIGMNLIQINSMDAVSGNIDVEVWMDYRWKDKRLTWDPAKYNITDIRLPVDVAWNHDVTLYNGRIDEKQTLFVVQNDGEVLHVSPASLKVRCPRDKSSVYICRFKFGSWSYNGFQLNLLNMVENVDLSNYVMNQQWTILNVTAQRNVVYYSCCPEPYPDVVYTITVQEQQAGWFDWNPFS